MSRFLLFEPGSKRYASDSWTMNVKKGIGGTGQEFQIGRATGD